MDNNNKYTEHFDTISPCPNSSQDVPEKLCWCGGHSLGTQHTGKTCKYCAIARLITHFPKCDHTSGKKDIYEEKYNQYFGEEN